MWQRPETERFMKTSSQLESSIKVSLAGTLAEELIFDDIGNGATSDLEHATQIARAMVMDYGMSQLGRIKFRDQATSFLGESSYATHHSPRTSHEIDEEVKRIINENLEATKAILADRRAALEAITAALLERETVEAGELKEIIEEASPSPMIVPGTLPDTGADRKPTPPPATSGEGESAEA